MSCLTCDYEVLDKESYERGIRAARKAIAAGTPFWISTKGRASGEFIHSETGLPYLGLSGPPELENSNLSYAKGYNDEVLNGVRSGSISVDFRPLLMTLNEIIASLEAHTIGTISEDSPRLEVSKADLILELKKRKTRHSGEITIVSFRRAGVEVGNNFEDYETPIRVALGKDGQVLVMETERSILTRDVVTTQVLNLFLRSLGDYR